MNVLVLFNQKVIIVLSLNKSANNIPLFNPEVKFI